MVRRTTLLMEFAWFVKRYRKFWLIPLLVVFLLLAALLSLSMLTGGAAAPFIYTIF